MRQMTITLGISMLALIVLGAWGNDVSAQQGPDTSVKSASCLICVREERPEATLTPETLSDIANSPAVLDEALKAVAARSTPRSQRTQARFTPTVSRRESEAFELSGRLIIDLDQNDSGIDESKLLEVVVANMRPALAKTTEAERRRLGIRREGIKNRLVDVSAEREKLRAHQTALLTKGTGAPISPVELEKTLIALSEKRRELELMLIGQDARRGAIAKAIVDLSARVEQHSNSDPVVREFLQVVDIRQRVLERARTLAASHTAPDSEVDSAVENLALARAEVAKARAAAAISAGGDQIAKLNADLTQVAIDSAEVRARAELLARQTDELRSGAAMSNAIEYDRAATRLREVETALASLATQVEDLERRAEQLEPPTVTIIGR